MNALEQNGLEKPLVVFDIESTGVDPATDRIITLCAWKLHEWGVTPDSLSIKVNPGVPIPKETTEVHGISDKDVKDLGLFKDYCQQIAVFFADCDLVGFNLLNFDIPILWEEFFRNGYKWDLEGTQVIDVGNIFKKKEERTLAAAVEFYCGVKHEDSHDAEGDVKATAWVLEEQLNAYADLKKMSVKELAEFSQFDKRVDLAGKIVMNDDGVAVYNIGKSKGVPVNKDSGFGHWMLDKDFTENTKQVLRKLLDVDRESPFN